MKKINKKIATVGVAFAMLVGLCGCGEKDVDVSKMSVEDFDATKAFSKEDIDWEVKETVVDGERTVTLDYTNNTKYTILEIEIDFVLKDGLTKEDLAVFDEVKEELEWTDEDVAELYMYSNNRKCAEPGESVVGSYSYICGLAYIDNMEQIAVMDYDVMEISFVGPEDNKYTIYYDFKNDEFSEATYSPEKLHEWSEYEIGDKLPEMDFVEVELEIEHEDWLSYSAYGVTYEDYLAYKQAVIDLGYQDKVLDTDDSYIARNLEGYKISLYYNAKREELSIGIDAPEE